MFTQLPNFVRGFLRITGGDAILATDGKTFIEGAEEVAAAGTTQGDAYACQAYLTQINTGSANTGIKLLPSKKGARYVVYNNTASGKWVYPNTGGRINNASANAPVYLNAHSTLSLFGTSSTYIWGLVNISNAEGVDTGGWIELSETWTYLSANEITAPAGADTRFTKNVKCRFKQGGDYKHCYLGIVGDDVVKAFGADGFEVEDAAITDIAISNAETPLGFPEEFEFFDIADLEALFGGSVSNIDFNIASYKVNGAFKTTSLSFLFDASGPTYGLKIPLPGYKSSKGGDQSMQCKYWDGMRTWDLSANVQYNGGMEDAFIRVFANDGQSFPGFSGTSLAIEISGFNILADWV